MIQSQYTMDGTLMFPGILNSLIISIQRNVDEYPDRFPGRARLCTLSISWEIRKFS